MIGLRVVLSALIIAAYNRAQCSSINKPVHERHGKVGRIAHQAPVSAAPCKVRVCGEGGVLSDVLCVSGAGVVGLFFWCVLAGRLLYA
jgi:hypothetical protein